MHAPRPHTHICTLGKCTRAWITFGSCESDMWIPTSTAAERDYCSAWSSAYTSQFSKCQTSRQQQKKWEKVASENWCVYEQGIKSIPQMHTPSNFFWHQFWFMRAGHFAFIWNICLHFYISKTRFDAEQTPVPLLDLHVSLHITLGRKQWLKSHFLTSFYPDYAFCYSSE